MPHDLRSFLAEIDELGYLDKVNSPVDPVTEIGSLFDQSRKPLLFTDLKGFPGWTACGELQAAALGVTPQEVIRELAQRFQRGPLAGKRVATGPVKERVYTGGDVDLTKLPIMNHSEKDGGPTIGAGMCVTKDPDTGAQNVATLRLELKDARRTGVLFVPRHSYKHFAEYERRNEKMPMAVVIGHHPLLDVTATWSVPYGMDEFEVAGALLGEPLDMVDCETIDLQAPARSEIVLEGHVLPNVRQAEGPFGEFQCYYLTGTGDNPIFEVSAVTMRDGAIYRHIQSTNYVEHQALISLPMEAHLFQRLSEVEGFIDLKDVYIPPYGGNFLTIIQLTPHFDGQVKDVLLGAMSSSYLHPKVIVAVDEDVDITKSEEVFWAISTRYNPAADTVLVEGTRNHPMDPSLPLISPPGQRWQRVGGKIGIDATRPPTSRAAERDAMQKTRPMGWDKLRLGDLDIERGEALNE